MSIQPTDFETAEPFEDISLEEDVEQTVKDAAREPSGNIRRRRQLLIGSVVLVLVAAAVAAGIAISLTDRAENESFTTEEEMRFSKAEVDSFCSQESTNSNKGLAQCTAACAPAGCCDPFNTDDSCFQENTESCLNYAKCQTVLADKEVAPARTDLAQVCSLESIAEDDTQCLDACEDVKCCYMDEDSCAATKFLTCIDYAPCQNLRNSTYKGVFIALPIAPPEILETCSPVSDRYDKDKCEEICKPAACCLGDVLPNEGGCLHSNFISCLTYTPCEGLTIPQINSVVPAPQSDLKEKCSLENVLGSDRDGCVEACSPADCCSSNEDNCLLEDPLGCLEYAQCGVLLLSGGDVPPRDDLDILCSSENIGKGGQALADCVEACEPSFCCASPSTSSNCLADNFFTCPQYWPCVQLFGLEAEGELLDSPPDNLNEECTGRPVSDKCKEMCDEASCCFAIDDSNCLLGGNQEVCAQWLTGGCWRVAAFFG